ncbi:MAG: hypothetical protein JOZ69_08135 [Myxococcales bacterium]|nr:hypothetical protein [Myxococcales bacterium]
MLVYRDLSRKTTGPALVAGLEGCLARGAQVTLEALLRAGELECAVADAGAVEVSSAMDISDVLGQALLGSAGATAAKLRAALRACTCVRDLTVRRPEGYAFYALDPWAYSALAREHAARSPRPVVVIGVRSIGTSLSALVRATFEAQGIGAERLTVRPGGHPFQRRLAFSDEQRRRLEPHVDTRDFVIVDEGPGLSGSTFLSVAEALVGLGVPASRVTCFTSHPGAPERWLAEDAVRRASRFTWRAASGWSAPAGALDLSAGRWRERVYASRVAFPACWGTHERVKYLSADGERLVKFAGLAPYDEGVRGRAEAVSCSGWSPPASRAEPGFSSRLWRAGRCADPARDRAAAIPVLARYLAFRSRECRAPAAASRALEEMARVNVREQFAVDLPAEFRLEAPSPIWADARLMAHEWIVMDGGAWMKTDAADHADDHFFPGPTDIAWDVAGALVEWAFDDDESASLLRAFHARAGDSVSGRLGPYLVAYPAALLGQALLAESTAPDAEEAARWSSEISRYRAALARALRALGLTPRGPQAAQNP